MTKSFVTVVTELILGVNTLAIQYTQYNHHHRLNEIENRLIDLVRGFFNVCASVNVFNSRA